MPTVYFKGSVLPPTQKLTFTGIPSRHHRDPRSGIQMVFTVEIIQSVVNVRVDFETPMHDYSELCDMANDIARACLDILAFGTGFHISVYIDKFIDADGATKDIIYRSPVVSGICTVCDLDPLTPDSGDQLFEMLSIILPDTHLFMALSDLIDALHGNQAPINCGRVLDGLRKIVAPDKKPKQGWNILGTLIQVESGYMEWISIQSVEPRHGGRNYVDANTIHEILRRTWTVMNRFLEYRKGGNQPLSNVRFPLISA